MPPMTNRYLSPLTGGAPAPTDPKAMYDELLQSSRTGAGAQDALNAYTQSAVNSAMPSFRNELQLTREDGIRRGISTGDLGTSFEGDLASAFQGRIANATAGQAAQLYESGQNRYADLLSGKLDRDQAEENAKRQKKGGLLSGIGSVLGGVGGFMVGGIPGAAAGAQIGGSAGRAIGGGY